jgi:hypothetical protein
MPLLTELGLFGVDVSLQRFQPNGLCCLRLRSGNFALFRPITDPLPPRGGQRLATLRNPIQTFATLCKGLLEKKDGFIFLEGRCRSTQVNPLGPKNKPKTKQNIPKIDANLFAPLCEKISSASPHNLWFFRLDWNAKSASLVANVE